MIDFDLVDRLRNAANVATPGAGSVMREAADDIERMREVLKPFAAIYEYFAIKGTLRPQAGAVYEWEDHRIGPRTLTVEHLKAAHEALLSTRTEASA